MPRAGRVARARAAPNRGSVLAFISKMIDSELRLGARVESDCQCTVTLRLAGVQVTELARGPGPPAGAGAKARRVRRPDAGAGGHQDDGPGQATASFKLAVSSTDSGRRRCQRRPLSTWQAHWQPEAGSSPLAGSLSDGQPEASGLSGACFLVRLAPPRPALATQVASGQSRCRKPGPGADSDSLGPTRTLLSDCQHHITTTPQPQGHLPILFNRALQGAAVNVRATCECRLSFM